MTRRDKAADVPGGEGPVGPMDRANGTPLRIFAPPLRVFVRRRSGDYLSWVPAEAHAARAAGEEQVELLVRPARGQWGAVRWVPRAGVRLVPRDHSEEKWVRSRPG